MLVELTDIERQAYLAGEEMPLLSANVQNNRPRKVWIVEKEDIAPGTTTNTGAKRHNMSTYRHCCRHVDLR